MQKAEKILQVETDINWLPQPNEGTIVLSSLLPVRDLIGTAFVLAFDGGRFLHTKLVKRGWDLPGGHVEVGETPEETARREAYEETGATLGPLHLLAYQRLRLLGPQPAQYKYPYPESYQVFYWAHLVALDTFIPTSETSARGLFTPDEAQTLPWVRQHTTLYQASLQAATGL